VAVRKDRGLRQVKDGTFFYVARSAEAGRYQSKVFRDRDPLTALEAAEQSGITDGNPACV
jgi:hypothetical protein